MIMLFLNEWLSPILSIFLLDSKSLAMKGEAKTQKQLIDDLAAQLLG